MMTIEQYAQEVKKMRDIQKVYFLTRGSGVLVAAKKHERIVDDITNEILLAQ